MTLRGPCFFNSQLCILYLSEGKGNPCLNVCLKNFVLAKFHHSTYRFVRTRILKLSMCQNCPKGLLSHRLLGCAPSRSESVTAEGWLRNKLLGNGNMLVQHCLLRTAVLGTSLLQVFSVPEAQRNSAYLLSKKLMARQLPICLIQTLNQHSTLMRSPTTKYTQMLNPLIMTWHAKPWCILAQCFTVKARDLI